MSCLTTLAALAQCLTAGLYVDTSIAWIDRGIEPMTRVVRDEFHHDGDGLIETGWTERSVHTNEPRNQYARVAIGFEVQMTGRCMGYAEVWHLSSLATGRDRGANAAAVGARCRVFGERR